ncbi:MAG: SRPBCC family protein [Thermoleophilia bacterium]|jgi:ligand-binding SRPBCC domain-containing protein|nr:SRPBCC family protein [Thermoleophilia bacterium]
MAVIERSVEIDVPASVLFHFHLDTRNAPLISPAGARFLAIEGEFPLVEGAEVRLKVRQPPMPVAQGWHIRADEIVPDRLLVDVALRSPFAAWRHEHRFDPLGPDRARMTDRVEYRLPLGPLGALADRLIVHRMLERTFAERQANTKAYLERR